MAISGLSPATHFDPNNPTLASVDNASPSAVKADIDASGNALNKLANDFDNFLTLLTTQLQNQDPLQPMDSKEFTSQLVQFTSVEQAIQSNKNLEKLIALTGGNTSSAAFGYIGKEIKTSNSSTNLAGGFAKWSYEVDPSASSSSISIQDAKGNTVFIQEGKTGAGLHEFVWDGKDKNGASFPDGVYSLSVTAVSSDKKPVSTKVFTTGVVDNVEITGEEPTLFIGGVRVGLKEVIAVSQDTYHSSATLNYIGREIRTINPRTNLSEGAANWTYELDPNTASSTLIVKDMNGKSVYEISGETGSGLHNFIWDGKDKNGELLPDGVYSLNVAGLNGIGDPTGARIYTRGTVSSIDTSSNEPLLMVGDVKVRLRDVLTVTEPAPIAANAAASMAEAEGS
ncbi:MAG TPA: hypothetical protein DCO82_11415 [Alphaproteobacteria bacterium]|jgi:flagellar basal-body rod modification protein FlgD|nr:hypothetical protein [Alphaproteobacteria bacterium]